MSKTGYEKYEIRVVNRRQLNNCPYNPRRISESARDKLKRNIRRVGLLEPLVWNERTGNLISGHQRLAILDELENRADYSLSVAVVNMSEKEEKEQVVFMNNPMAQGEYDSELLVKFYLENKDIDPLNTGIDYEDYIELTGGANIEEESAMVEEAAEQLRSMRDYHNRMDRLAVKVDKQSLNDTNFYAVLVFYSEEARDRFLERIGIENDHRFIDGMMFYEKLMELGAVPAIPLVDATEEYYEKALRGISRSQEDIRGEEEEESEEESENEDEHGEEQDGQDE